MRSRQDKYFEGKVAVVTGSTMGIGRAIARELCRRGASVVLNGRDPDRLSRAQVDFSAAGYTVAACQADATIYNDCERMVKLAVERFGRLDIIIPNAASVGFSPFEDFEHVSFRTALDSNLYGSVFPVMASMAEIKKSRGSILFISSLAGMMGMPYYSAYSAGKMALTALSQSIRSELKGTGVHVGIVFIGFAENEEEKRFIDKSGKLVIVPPRKKWMQMKRDDVAVSVVNIIYRRKNVKVLSFLGMLNSFLVRFFPFITRAILEKNTKADIDYYNRNY
jgi:short-subunit dehydrogenase